MKQILIILSLFASVSTFAQSPRIKLNQITKDTVKGSVLISSPTDSGMVYSRDLFVSYGADTFLILGGDTLAATSGLISSVLSDGVTITGDGTTGSELTVDTSTVIATKGDLSDYVNISGTQTITGAKTFTSALTQSAGDVDFDSGTFFVDESENRVGIGTISPSATLDLGTGNKQIKVTQANITEVYIEGEGVRLKNILASGGWARSIVKYQDSLGVDYFGLGGFGGGQSLDYVYLGPAWNNNYQVWESTGDVGIGTTSPSYKLHVNGSVAGVGAYNNLSDVNWKKNIQDITYGLDKILKLKPITFNWLNEDYGDRINIGFIAQEVEEIIPNMVTTAEDGTKSLAITDLIPVLTKAIQEQQAIIESIQTELNVKSSIIESQSTEIEQLKSQIQLILSEIEQIKNN